jgi:hypothetical protein
MILTVAFLCRSIIILVDIFLLRDPLSSMISKVVNQMLFELLPVTLILWILGRKIPQNVDAYVNTKETRPLINGNDGPKVIYHRDSDG